MFHRVVGSMLPLPQRNFLQTHIRPSPDLYGMIYWDYTIFTVCQIVISPIFIVYLLDIGALPGVLGNTGKGALFQGNWETKAKF